MLASLAQDGISPPTHEPAFVAALVSDNDGNRRRNLLGGNVEARNKGRKVAVEIPANPNVTKLKSSADAAHIIPIAPG